MYKQGQTRLRFHPPFPPYTCELNVLKSSLPLVYVFLYPCCYLRSRLNQVVKDSPISLLPYIPEGVDNYPVQSPTLRSWHFRCRVFPPGLDVGGVYLEVLLQLSEVFPR